ncbi:hypothetical protein E5288_WYG003095 [Bos mutus]|uniref:Uncharacterized protein n=1 Tax=Bos mutus TaxID=72004 RepID=A0A6B0R8E2_9CETA|nr:hypothetical protein [Bos mutus]
MRRSPQRPKAFSPESPQYREFQSSSRLHALTCEDRCSALEVEKKLLKTAFQPVPRRSSSPSQGHPEGLDGKPHKASLPEAGKHEHSGRETRKSS